MEVLDALSKARRKGMALLRRELDDLKLIPGSWLHIQQQRGWRGADWRKQVALGVLKNARDELRRELATSFGTFVTLATDA